MRQRRPPKRYDDSVSWRDRRRKLNVDDGDDPQQTATRRRSVKQRRTDRVISIFQRYAAKEALSRKDMLYFNKHATEDNFGLSSWQPVGETLDAWKAVILHSRYNGPRALAADGFLFDRFPCIVTAYNVLPEDLRIVLGGTYVGDFEESRELSDFYRQTSCVAFP